MAQGIANLRAAAAEPRATANETKDLGLAGLVLLAQFHEVASDAQQLAHRYGRSGEPFDEQTLLLAAKHLGLKARIVAQAAARLDKITLPALSLQADGQHFIVAKASEQSILIHDLRLQRPQVLSRTEFDSRYSGRLLVVTSRASVLGELAKFDFRWFVPAVVKACKPASRSDARRRRPSDRRSVRWRRAFASLASALRTWPVYWTTSTSLATTILLANKSASTWSGR